MCLFPHGLQGDEGPIRLHPQPYGPLQADSLTDLEALSGDPDLYHHESPAGGSTGKHTTSDITKTTLLFCGLKNENKVNVILKILNVFVFCVCVGSPVADSARRHHSVPVALSGAQYGSFAGALFAYWHHQ